MARYEYLLTGFGDFWERRCVTFVEPPSHLYVCSFCGSLPSQSKVLTCRHVTCGSCEQQLSVSGQCCLDRQPFSILEASCLELKLAELEQLNAHCFNDTCGFKGPLGQIKAHLPGCIKERAKCRNCDAAFFRKDLMQHYQGCLAETPSLRVVERSSVVDGLAHIKHEVRNFQELASGDAALVEKTNSLVLRLSTLEAVLSKTHEDIKGPGDPSLLAPKRAGCSAGPFRAARKAGVFVATCFFEEIHRTLQAFEEKNVVLKATDVTLAGYSVKLMCKLIKDTHGDVSFSFGLRIEDGDWNNIVEWPFAKTAHVVLTHPSDDRKDVRMVILMDNHALTKKPWPHHQNKISFTEKFSWEIVEREGFIYDGSLIATLEFE